MGLALDEWGLINGDLNWFQSHTGPCIHQTLSLCAANCPITHTANSFSVHLLTQAKTNCSFFLSPFMLRRTSIHSYNIPEEANTGSWCAWSLQQTWPDTSLEWSARLAMGVSADPLFNNLALHTQTHGHPSRAPLFSSFSFCQVPVPGIVCFIPDTYYDGLLHMHLYTETSKRKHNTTHMPWSYWLHRLSCISK